MKAITTQAVIEGIRSRKDKSLGLTITTPELTATEKAMFMDLQGVAVNMLVAPVEGSEEAHKVDSDLNTKSQSQRMRAVLYILWKQKNEGMDFQEYYHKKTEKLIEWLKGKIEE